MKKILALALATVMALGVLAGCGSNGSGSGSNAGSTSVSDVKNPEELAALYKEAIENSGLDKEIIQYNPIITDPKNEQIETIQEITGLDFSQFEAFATSISLMNIQAYGVAVVKPVEGQEEAVKAGLQTYLDNTKKSFEQYLEDQLEVAKAAKLETLEDGTIVMVMTQGQDEIFESISNTILGK